MRMLEKEKLGGSIELKTDALSSMDSLMLLQLNYVHMNGSYENFPKELRGLCMHGFHLKSIPSDLPMENLVALDMSYSNIESFFNCYSNPDRLEKRQKLDGSCLKDKMLLGSLKILNLSFCTQLRILGDFDQLPALERLILRNCIALVEISESIEQCVGLFFIDMSYCKKLEKLPRNISMLKNVKTVMLDGCNLSDSRIENRDVDSMELCKANNIGINIRTSSSAFVGGIPSDLKLFSVSLPRSLVSLSLANNNLSTESFPMDFSSLIMLRHLYLDDNPIDSMPSCVRTLPMLQILSMEDCKKLKSIEHPPHTLRALYLFSDHKSYVEKIAFDPEMSPLDVFLFLESSDETEIEGMFKILPMVAIEEKVLHSLGWTNLDFLNDRSVGTNSSESEIQMMFYEFGIFSTLYVAGEMPSWFRHRSAGPSISFTIPSSSSSSPSNRLIGLNFCSLHTLKSPDERFLFPYDDHFPPSPMMTISNITKNRMWIYERHRDRKTEGQWVLLSHWMFGMNEMEARDLITITVTLPYDEVIKECGVSLMYDDGEKKDEDALGYYKSWNHIIGGDLSPFQTTTGEYILSKSRFFRPAIKLSPYHRKFIADGPNYQAQKEDCWFRAFSQRNPGTIG